MPQPAAAFDLPRDTILALPADGEVLYRLLRRELPEARDFMSNLTKNKRPFPDEHPIYYAGMSMFELKSQALSRARRKHVASVVLEPGKGFHIAKTRGAGHYTVWGDAEQLLEVSRAEDDDA